ncbi:MAG: hypothetical protein SO116_05230 [Treponema sp.]|nr:hypothetical protein [Spirochaetia bacterium]MDD7013620.1 hypothetical protein [Spirochaetales bacterium]MDY4902258.1 hypothetical protein [Treponema sp.]
MKLKFKISLEKNFISLVAAGVFFGALIFAIIRFLCAPSAERRIFAFQSYDTDKLCYEVRYLPSKPMQGDIGMFADEILLGPMTNRYKRLFPSGTKTDFCFLKGKDLYLGLTKEAFNVKAETFDIKSNIELLKKNIVMNFTYIEKINIFVDGKFVSPEEKNAG